MFSEVSVILSRGKAAQPPGLEADPPCRNEHGPDKEWHHTDPGTVI